VVGDRVGGNDGELGLRSDAVGRLLLEVCAGRGNPGGDGGGDGGLGAVQALLRDPYIQVGSQALPLSRAAVDLDVSAFRDLVEKVRCERDGCATLASS